MKYAREHMPEAADEVSDLVHYYFGATRAGEGMDPLEFKWDAYKELDARGRLLFVTAREDNQPHRLRGFVNYFMHAHMHHRQVLATCDMIAVHPDHRNHGVGSYLMDYAEQWLKAQGVTHIVHNFRLIYPDDPLFIKHGYKAEETSYVKDIR